MISLEPHAQGVIVHVRVRPAARRNGIVGEHDGALRVDVTAAPEKGKANKAVAEVLAELFGVSKSAVELVSGQTSSQKRFLIVGVELAVARGKLSTG
jgi:uncharacterized protein (TIGR00251 family)